MKILQVVTLFSPDAAYGGPLRVALNQSKALQDNGHDVTIAAASRGYETAPTHEQGIPLKLFPARSLLPKTGYAGMAAPTMLWWLRSHMADYDVVHVHLARDLVTLPVARLARNLGVPFVAQTHGMIDSTDKLLARPLDKFLTVPSLRGAGTVFYLNDKERVDLESVAGTGIALHELTNGIPEADDSTPDVVDDRFPDVLYLARLQARKRPRVFVEAAVALLDRGYAARFSLVGPDEGEAAPVREMIESSGHHNSIHYEGPLPFDKTAERYRHASVYVLPAVDEPFGMSVLEAMSVGLPVVVTDSCGLAPLIEEERCGTVVDASAESLATGIGWLLANPTEAKAMGARGRAAARDRVGMSRVRDVLEVRYRA